MYSGPSHARLDIILFSCKTRVSACSRYAFNHVAELLRTTCCAESGYTASLHERAANFASFADERLPLMGSVIWLSCCMESDYSASLCACRAIFALFPGKRLPLMGVTVHRLTLSTCVHAFAFQLSLQSDHRFIPCMRAWLKHVSFRQRSS